jgi:hypothetical protein
VPFEHDSYAGELLADALREPNPVAALRRRLTVARQRIEDASTEECACEEALAEAERLLAESEEADVPPRETPRPETIALVERLIAESGADPSTDHR